jgi:NDP-sugar pyrophosphorylase family protein
MEITLVVLAAGMASRYGAMKQTEGFGPGGETIMDYSIYDAIRAGFTKVVFIIRKDFADSFESQYNEKLKGRIAVAYVYQEMNAFVGSGQVPSERTKPWGTGHAVLCASSAIHEPFAVINADDFYGADAFQKAAVFLKNDCNRETYGIIGYRLGETLSDFGSVSRGVCEVNDSGDLISITERTKIIRQDKGIYFEENGEMHSISGDNSVSMNFWCFHPSVFELSKKLFEKFLQSQSENLKSEFFIPIIADAFISETNGKIKVVQTSGQWFGVTYKEDAPDVIKKLATLISDKAYPEYLYETVQS